MNWTVSRHRERKLNCEKKKRNKEKVNRQDETTGVVRLLWSKNRDKTQFKNQGENKHTGNSRQSANRNAGAGPSGCVRTETEAQQMYVMDRCSFIDEEIHQTGSSFPYVARTGSCR